MKEILLEYPYKARPRPMLVAMAFFGACAAEGTHVAVTNDRGLIVHGIFRFSVKGATVFYWCLAAVSTLFVLAAIIALAMNFNRRLLRLTSTEVSFPPHGFARKPIVIALSDITLITTRTVEKQRFINIYHRTGASSESAERKSSVAQSMLPNPEAFEKLNAALLAIRGRKNRQ
jgi:hypothetical protein